MKLIAMANLATSGTALAVDLASNVAQLGFRLLEAWRREIELNDRRFAPTVGILLAIAELELLL